MAGQVPLAEGFAEEARIQRTVIGTPNQVEAVTATRAPSSARRWAVARPIPLPAPVTSATFPATERLPVVSLAMPAQVTGGAE